jgi:hypothetical protein
MNRTRFIFTLATLAAVLLMFACSGSLPDKEGKGEKDSTLVPDAEFYGATHYIYDGGRVTAKILTDSTWTFEANDSTVAWDLDVTFYDSLGHVSGTLVADSGVIRTNIGEYRIYGNLEADFFDSLGAPSSHLVGDSGLIQEETGYLHVYDHVVVISENDRKVETTYLRWNSATDVIDTDAYVKFTRGTNDVITTYGMIADRGLNRVRLLNQVSGTVIRNEEKKD